MQSVRGIFVRLINKPVGLLLITILLIVGSLPYSEIASAAKDEVATEVVGSSELAESDLQNQSIFTRALQGGVVVFLCLMLLVLTSALTWGIVVAKSLYLVRIQQTNDTFIKSFWDSRSLNDLNSRLQDHPYSSSREIFRSGYAELVRGSQLREQAATTELAVGAAMDNLQRALSKAKLHEKRRMEKYLPILAISASAAPFVGLFGTVWGIMGAFEGIAQSGSTSLAAVAPGISEALIATAFGLAAAIPAVVAYNLFANRIRLQMGTIDGFVSDFLNIVERYLVTDRNVKSAAAPSDGPL
jgi:biopolymer transport protein TolQ